ncbi:hypothetical protein Nmel_002727 [Mimus melanotis]
MYWNNDTRLPQYCAPLPCAWLHLLCALLLHSRINRSSSPSPPSVLQLGRALLPGPMAPVLQPSVCPMASMGLVPTSSCLQEPRTRHSVSAAVSEVPTERLLGPAQP